MDGLQMLEPEIRMNAEVHRSAEAGDGAQGAISSLVRVTPGEPTGETGFRFLTGAE